MSLQPAPRAGKGMTRRLPSRPAFFSRRLTHDSRKNTLRLSPNARLDRSISLRVASINPAVIGSQMRVLILADDCNPEWPSLPIVGYKAARAIAEHADVTVATHVRNRNNIEK